MSASAAPSPLPWTAEPKAGRGAWINGSDGSWAALSCGDNDDMANANAALIVHRVNTWDALVEALERCLPVDDEGKRLRDAALRAARHTQPEETE